MAGATLTNKRKRNQTDAAADSSKKSKKLKNPPPAEPKEDEASEEEEEDSRYEDAVSNLEQENDNEDGESDAGEGSDLEDNAVARNADGDVIPADSAPILSTLAESDKFEDLKLTEKTMRAIQEMGFTKMTSIQRSVRLPLQIVTPMTCIC
jgi:ATP-dependent RNA helicase DDX18/HAS1